MPQPARERLSRRERQIMDIVYRLGSATVAEVLAEMEDAPSYSSVRTMMSILEDKGHLIHAQDGARYVYHPTRTREDAGQSALSSLVETFYDGSPGGAIAALLELPEGRMSEDELDRLAALIERSRTEGR